MKSTISLSVVGLGLLASALPVHAAANILLNGSFEDPAISGPTAAANWSVDPDVVRNSVNPSDGAYDMEFTVSGSTSGQLVANAFSDHVAVTGGSTYSFAYDVSGVGVGFGPGSVLNVFVDFYGSTGGLVDRHLVTGGFTGPMTYVTKSYDVTAPASAVTASIFINFVTGAFEAAAGDILIDNVKLVDPNASAPVSPEPASLSLLAIGALALLRRK